MKQILLPQGPLGIAIMLLMMLLIFTVPFVLTAWLVSLVAPWWVSLPCATFVAMLVFVFAVKFK
jgi:hypothetical protein